jgi:hypothetical protein
MTAQPTLETWEMKAKRLALALKAAKPDPFKSTPMQRTRYMHLRYAMQFHLENVTEDA